MVEEVRATETDNEILQRLLAGTKQYRITTTILKGVNSSEIVTGWPGVYGYFLKIERDVLGKSVSPFKILDLFRQANNGEIAEHTTVAGIKFSLEYIGEKND